MKRRGYSVAMGLVVSLILIAVGAILVWGVNAESTDFNVDAVGVILMIVGFVAFILSMMMWRSFWGPGAFTSRRTYVEGGGRRSAGCRSVRRRTPPRRPRGRGRRPATRRAASSLTAHRTSRPFGLTTNQRPPNSFTFWHFTSRGPSCA